MNYSAKQNAGRIWDVSRPHNAGKGSLFSIQVKLYKDQLRTCKQKMEFTNKLEKPHLCDDILEKADEMGEKPLLGAVKQMHEIK